MKQKIKLLVFFFCALVVCMITVSTLASEITQDGINVTLTTDKAEYTSQEKISAIMTIKNFNSDSATNIILEHLLPMGYRLLNNTSPTKQLQSLKSGESVSFGVVYGEDTTSIPITGDSSQPHLWTLLCLISISGIVLPIACRNSRNKRRKSLFSLLMCFSILCFSLIQLPFQVDATQNDITGSINITHVIKISGRDFKIKGFVAYTLPKPSGVPASGFVLRSSDKVIINGEGSVRLYLETDLSVDSITLWYGEVNNLNKSILMYDTGKGNDDIAGDGIYSASTPADSQQDTKIHFVAKHEKRISNEVVVSFYNAISEDTIMAMEIVDNAILTLLNQPGFMEKIEDEKISLIQNMLTAFENEGRIQSKSISVDKENQLVSFLYPEGILGGIMYSEFEKDKNGIERTEVPDSYEVYNIFDNFQPQFRMFSMNSTQQTDEVGTAIILNSFPTFETASDAIIFRTDFYETLETSWDSAGLVTDLVVNPTVNNYKNIGSYNIVCISTHGSRYSWRDGFLWLDYHEYSAICLAESRSNDKDKTYQAELKDKQIAKVSGNYWLLPSFFENQYDDNDLSNTFIFSECCQALGEGKGSDSSKYDYTMPNAFTGRSAKAYIGFHNSVYAVYSRDFMKAYVDDLIAGKTSKKAFDICKTTLGSDHKIWYETTYSPKKYDSHTPIAYPVHCGSDTAVLVQTFQNGNFEKYSTSSTEPTYWNCLGDARTLTQLGPIKPSGVNSKRMAILTTGIGAQQNVQFGNGTEGSAISQTFHIPSNATKLIFDYNFISEEPMEYVGSQYDDSFLVKIDHNKSTNYSRTYASINTSNWIAVDGVDFIGGDHTTYQTGWKKAEIDINGLRNKVVTLSFIVFDVGDEIYDSACVIDQVEIK